MARRQILLSTALSLLIGANAVAETPQSSFDAKQTEDIGRVVRDYLVSNPEVLVEAMQAYEAKMTAQASAAQSAALDSLRAELMATPDGTVIGNPDGDVTVVEFFDYNCGYCRRALPDMEALVKDDPNLRFVLKEVAVLGPQSVEASRVSLAFREVLPKQYAEFHKRLMTAGGVADEAKAIGVAEELGVAEAELRKAMASPAVSAAMDADAAMAQTLQLQGTPAYVIADEVVPGAVGAEVLAEKVANARKCGKTTC